MALREEQYKAIELLLVNSSYEDVARQLGISARSIRRWLHDEEFASEYREAQWQGFGQALGILRHHSAEAALQLREEYRSPKPSQTRVTAATNFLNLAIRMSEVFDLRDRVAQLESLVKQLSTPAS